MRQQWQQYRPFRYLRASLSNQLSESCNRNVTSFVGRTDLPRTIGGIERQATRLRLKETEKATVEDPRLLRSAELEKYMRLGGYRYIYHKLGIL